MPNDRRNSQAVHAICLGALVAAGCSSSPSTAPADAEPGSKAAASPPPKDVPTGVKVGKGRAELQ